MPQQHWTTRAWLAQIRRVDQVSCRRNFPPPRLLECWSWGETTRTKRMLTLPQTSCLCIKLCYTWYLTCRVSYVARWVRKKKDIPPTKTSPDLGVQEFLHRWCWHWRKQTKWPGVIRLEGPLSGHPLASQSLLQNPGLQLGNVAIGFCGFYSVEHIPSWLFSVQPLVPEISRSRGEREEET